MSGYPTDYSHPKYNRFRDVPFSRIYDKAGNDVTRERKVTKTLGRGLPEPAEG